MEGDSPGTAPPGTLLASLSVRPAGRLLPVEGVGPVCAGPATTTAARAAGALTPRRPPALTLASVVGVCRLRPRSFQEMSPCLKPRGDVPAGSSERRGPVSSGPERATVTNGGMRLSSCAAVIPGAREACWGLSVSTAAHKARGGDGTAPGCSCPELIVVAFVPPAAT